MLVSLQRVMGASDLDQARASIDARLNWVSQQSRGCEFYAGPIISATRHSMKVRLKLTLIWGEHCLIFFTFDWQVLLLLGGRCIVL